MTCAAAQSAQQLFEVRCRYDYYLLHPEDELDESRGFQEAGVYVAARSDDDAREKALEEFRRLGVTRHDSPDLWQVQAINMIQGHRVVLVPIA